MADVSTLGIELVGKGFKEVEVGMAKVTEESKKLVAVTQELLDRQALFQRTLNKTATATEKVAESTDKMTGAVAKGAFTALQIDRAVSAVVGKVFSLGEAFIELGFAVGKYQDIADRTMADPAGLARLQTAADVSGTSIESVGTSLQQMQRQLSATGDASKGAGKALAAIGLNLVEFKQLAPDQQYRALALALDGFADSGEKVAVIQAIMGRGGAQQLGMLKELASQGEQTNYVTAEMIKASDDAGDSIKRQQSEMKQLIGVMAVPMLEAVSGVTTVIHDLILEITGLREEGTRAKANNDLRTFAWDVADAFAGAIDQVDLFSRLFVMAGKTMAATAATTKAFLTSNPSTMIATMRSIGQEYDQDMQALIKRETFGAKVQAARAKADQRAAEAAAKDKTASEQYDDTASRSGKDIKPAIDFTAGGDKKTDSERASDSVQKYIDTTKLAIEVQRAAIAQQKESGEHIFNAANYEDQLAKATEHSAAQMAKANTVTGKRGDILRQEVIALNKASAAQDVELELIKRGRLVREAANKATNEEVTRLEEKASATRFAADVMAEENSMIDRSSDAIAQLAFERDAATEASLRATAAFLNEHYENDATAVAYIELADAMRKATAEKIKAIGVSTAKEAKSAQDLADQYGLSADALHNLIQQKLRDRLADAQANAEKNSAWSLEVEQLQRLIDQTERLYALRKKSREDPAQGVADALRKYSEEAQNLGEAMNKITTDSIKGVEDAMVDMVMTGKADVKSLINMMISEFMRLMVIKPMLSSIFGNGSSGSSIFSSLFSAGIEALGGGGVGMGVDYSLPTSGVRFRAAGGPVSAGDTYVVGEKGPEVLTMGSSGGSITSNDKLGGKTVNITMAPNIRIDARADAGQVAKNVRAAILESQKGLLEELRAQGALA